MLAAAWLAREHGQTTMAAELLKEMSVDKEIARTARCDEFDRKALKGL